MNRQGRNGCVQAGMSLSEAVVVVMLAAITLSVALPNIAEFNRAAALNGAAGRLRGLMFRCRAFAIMNQRSTGLVFERSPGGSWRCFIAADGDGDGILRRDIDRGVDPTVSEVLEFAPKTAGIGILDGVAIPDPSGRGRLRGDCSDPVRAGRGDIITFTPRGHATPSSVYLTDGKNRMRVLRIYGASSRINSLVWRRGWNAWRRSAL